MDGDEKVIVYVDSDLEDIVPGFLENRSKDITTIMEALLNNDYEAIRIIGHGMKGSGGGYGFDKISDIGREIEIEAKSGNSEKINEQIVKLSSYLERIEVVYE
jgi:HPt (histidine-containing phosphotransfer) domain-containing protein